MRSTNFSLRTVWKMRVLLLTITGSFLPFVSNAHKEPVHAGIAQSAVLSSDGLTRFANEMLSGIDAKLFF